MKKYILLFAAVLPISFLFTLCSFSGKGDDAKTLDYFIKDERNFLVINQALDIRNNVTYLLFEKAKMYDEAANAQLYLKAMKVKNYSNKLCNYIHEIKSELVSKAMNVPTKTADTLRPEALIDPGDTKLPAQYLVGNDPSNPDGQVKMLQQKIKEYSDNLQLLADSSGASGFYQRMWQLKVDEVYSPREGKMVSWACYNFEGITMVAALARLTAIEASVRIAEGDAIMEIYSKAKTK
jgi:hypothetical protein